MKIAIIHDYFIQNGGAEKVVESLLSIYPTVDLYTSVFVRDNFIESPFISLAYSQGRVKASLLQRLYLQDNAPTGLLKFSKHLYFLYPTAMSLMKISGYDLVIISSTYCAKNIRLGNNHKIIHYCHSPTRFLHGLVTEKDHSTLPLWQRIVSKYILNPVLRYQDNWAVKTLVSNDTTWITNSKFIRQTVKDVYHVDSDVIYPPVEIDKFIDIVREVDENDEFYLCHGRISFHKRLDLAIKACIETKKKLIISGTSALETDMEQLKSLVPPEFKDKILFLGRTTDQELTQLVSKAKAMLFPGKEDAGIAPIEMIASGLPVIAYKSGGALEYVQEGLNGVFFEEQTVSSLVEAIIDFENQKFDTTRIKNSVQKFSESNFKVQFRAIAK
jgi:glycosyltransferase involved in cell wall biosynthesis